MSKIKFDKSVYDFLKRIQSRRESLNNKDNKQRNILREKMFPNHIHSASNVSTINLDSNKKTQNRILLNAKRKSLPSLMNINNKKQNAIENTSTMLNSKLNSALSLRFEKLSNIIYKRRPNLPSTHPRAAARICSRTGTSIYSPKSLYLTARDSHKVHDHSSLRNF